MNCRMPHCLLALAVAVAWPGDFTARAADRKPNVIHVVSAVNGGPWASLAELGVIGK